MKFNRRKSTRIISLITVLAMVMTLFAGVAFATTSTTTRVSGADRYATSVEVAKAKYSSASTVIITRGDVYADGLAASVLAAALNAPILLTASGSLPSVIADGITSLGATKAVVLGGTAAVSADVVTALTAKGLTVERVAGADRYATAAAVAAKAKAAGSIANYAFIVNGHASADSLIAGVAAFNAKAPILQVTKDSIPQVTLDALDELDIDRVYIVGGTAVVSNAVMEELEDILTVEARLAGATRYATAVEFAKVMFANVVGFSIVRGADANLADAIGAAVLGRPVLYVEQDSVPAVVSSYVNNISNTNFTIIGGTAAVGSAVENTLKGTAPDAVAVESVTAINAGQIRVVFSAKVEKTSAQTATNYTVASKTDPDLGIVSVKLQDDGVTAIVTLVEGYDEKTTLAVTVKEVQLKDNSSVKIPLFAATVVVDDQTAPSVSKVTAATNGDSTQKVEITFSEPIESGVVRINGASYGDAATDKDSSKITISGVTPALEVGKTHTLQVVNLTDRGDNVADVITQTFTVTKDTVRPAISSVTTKSDSTIVVAFNKKMDTDGTVEAGLIIKDETFGVIAQTVVKDSDDSTNTKWVITISDNIYSSLNSRTLNLVLEDTVEDYLGNTARAATRKVTMTKDTVAPTVTGLSFKKDSDGKVTHIVATFSEDVEENGFPTVVDKDGVLKSGWLNLATASNNKIEYRLATAAKLSGKWTFTFAKGVAQDKAITSNDSAAFTGTIDFGTTTATFKITAGDIDPDLDGNKNVIEVYFGGSDGLRTVKGGVVAGSATDRNNYTLNGSVLAAGTTITLNTDKNIATITLPRGTVPKDDADAIFTVANVQDTSGNVITRYVGTIDVKDDTDPVLSSAQVIGNIIVLTFNEDMAFINETDVDFINDNFLIKCGTSEVTVTAGGIERVSGAKKKLQITVSTGTNWDSSKTVTIKTKANTTATQLIDDSHIGNTLKANVQVTATK